MFPSKLPLLFLVHALGVLIAVFLVLALLQNPLGLLGLYFMPQVPLVPEDQGYAGVDPDDPNRDPNAGFLANLG